MDFFRVNSQFDDYNSVMEMKKKYEKATNSLLVKSDCNRLANLSSKFGKKFIYKRIVFVCKAGRERKCRSKGIRKSSTYKKNCPVKVRINLSKKKFVVTLSNLNHQYHNTDKATFDHYPEHLRIPPEKIEEVKRMIAVGATKRLIKLDLMKDGETIVPLKALHNLQTKMRMDEYKEFDGVDVLQKLLKKMEGIPNARVRVVTNEENELIGIYFQDDRMAQMYEKYPEVLLYDTTYKMNNKDLPLVLQLCIDGNGETEICNIFVAQSESRLCIGAMVDIFQELNPAWQKTKVIIGDKDFADRVIYKEKFPDAALQICLYHVLVTFGREVTTAKRNITKNEREAALEVIQRIVYCTSEMSYDSIYQELIDLDLEEVTEYYNDNWHAIRDEWTLFGRNKFANYLNWTNNRTESINQKFKMLANRYANLLTFFTNLFATVTILASERNVRSVRATMRVYRCRFSDESLAKYNRLLTPFVFKKIEEQFELAKLIKFAVLSETNGTTEKAHDAGHLVTAQNCSCMFFSAMKIPCRHILQFLQLNELDTYRPDLVERRWTLAYFYKSHPALNNYEHVEAPRPMSFTTIRVPEEIEKYKKTAKLTKDINNFAASMSNSQFQYFYDKINDMRNEIISTNNNGTTRDESCETVTSTHHSPAVISSPSVSLEYEMQSEVNDFSDGVTSTITAERVASNVPQLATDANRTSIEPHRVHRSNLPQTITSNQTYRTEIFPTITSNRGTVENNDTPMSLTESTNEMNCYQRSDALGNVAVTSPETDSFRRSDISESMTLNNQRLPAAQTPNLNTPVSQTSIRNDMAHIILPPSIVSVGRPKGTGKTAINLKRKNTTRNGTKAGPQPKKMKFLERKSAEQGILIVKWLTNWPSVKVGSKKVTNGDIIQDPNIFNRLKHKDLDLNCIKKFLDAKTFKYIGGEVDRLRDMPYTCTKCRKYLNGLQVMCHGCLDWFHGKCIGVTSKTANLYFCTDCLK